MTHDELIDEIDFEIGSEEEISSALISLGSALRAVVELHKPQEFESDDEQVLVCSHCQWGVVGDTYPCTTIKVIVDNL